MVHIGGALLVSAQAMATPRRYVVVHAPCVKVRSEASVASEQRGIKQLGVEVYAESIVSGTDGAEWLKLTRGAGWLLCHGDALGLGVLVQPLSDAPRDDSERGLLPVPPLVVQCTDGLCNRLRVVLSFVEMSRRTGRKLFVVWPLKPECDGRFNDAFAAIDGVDFFDEPPIGLPPPQVGAT